MLEGGPIGVIRACFFCPCCAGAGAPGCCQEPLQAAGPAAQGVLGDIGEGVDLAVHGASLQDVREEVGCQRLARRGDGSLRPSQKNPPRGPCAGVERRLPGEVAGQVLPRAEGEKEVVLIPAHVCRGPRLPNLAAAGGESRAVSRCIRFF